VETDKETPFKSSKPYDLTLEYRPQYLYAFIRGEKDSYEISRQYWQEIADECNRSGIKKVLIEEDIAENISMPDMYRFASEIPEFGFHGVRVAFVDRQESQYQLNQFGETVATNRGLVSRVFNNFADGEKWLLSE
jgi:hypothetical protein